MVYISIVFITFCILGSILSMFYYKEWYKSIDKKEHKLYFLYPISYFILLKSRIIAYLNKNDKVKNSLQALQITKSPDMNLYWCSKISLLLFVLLSFLILSVFVQLDSLNEHSIIEGKYLKRPSQGEGHRDIELKLNLTPIQKLDNMTSKEISIEEDLTIRVEEKDYSEEQRKEIFKSAIQYLDEKVLGENKTPDNITNQLNFISHIPGTSIKVKWKSQNYNLIKSDGSIRNEELKKEGVVTTIIATLSYKDYVMEFEKPLRIMPKVYTEEERIRKKLENELEKSSNNTKEKEFMELPDTLESYQLNWAEKKEIGGGWAVLGIILAIFIWFYQDKEMGDKMNKRNKEMLMDYPEIINKITLLVNAGMTVKHSWYKITEDYDNKKKANTFHKRYAYEEMRVTAHELNLGVSESFAYEQFGRRTGLHPYMKMSTLLVQNLKKGSKGLTELLYQEAQDAFSLRKEIAKRQGEEAGTKMLLPMLLMLLIVLTIILIPAFMSFRL